LVICHDGTKSLPYEKEYDFDSSGLDPIYLNTSDRVNDWGHSSRDLALKYAYENLDADYYVIFNIDNTLFPNALDKINKKIEESGSPIITFGIFHKKENRDILGDLPILSNIDAMQLVAQKNIWSENNFWHDKRMASDGYIYEKMCSENAWSNIPEILGINR
jgi:hypothetical protein